MKERGEQQTSIDAESSEDCGATKTNFDEAKLDRMRSYEAVTSTGAR
jgi:hypothetical protein